ncbi:MAG: glycerophosphodiester phosphodiesterase [Candidatus Baltobacteraceae bacterium]
MSAPADLVWPYPNVFAHRGGGALAPENTLAGFDVAARHGQAAAEFDVKLSADDVPFLLHDDTVERTSNGRGAAASLRYVELAGLDAGGWFGPEFAGERMPTLGAAADRCALLGFAANVEIKPSPGRERETGQIVAAQARTLWAGERAPLLSSFSCEALGAAREIAPELPRGLLVGEVPPDWSERAAQLGCLSLHVNHRALDADLVRHIRAAGLFILAYTVNDPARARELLDWGVSAICTDRIERIAPTHVS